MGALFYLHAFELVKCICAYIVAHEECILVLYIGVLVLLVCFVHSAAKQNFRELLDMLEPLKCKASITERKQRTILFLASCAVTVL